MVELVGSFGEVTHPFDIVVCKWIVTPCRHWWMRSYRVWYHGRVAMAAMMIPWDDSWMCQWLATAWNISHIPGSWRDEGSFAAAATSFCASTIANVIDPPSARYRPSTNSVSLLERSRVNHFDSSSWSSTLSHDSDVGSNVGTLIFDPWSLVWQCSDIDVSTEYDKYDTII